ncbi:MAG: hypothetical protein Q8R92_15690 [Deltaproteobacteria bacterium]|nr:hypothetical protein [Deltaproteobacteria bacterium]
MPARARLALPILLLVMAVYSPAAAEPARACPTPLAVMKPPDMRASCSSGTRADGRLRDGAILPDAGCGFRRIFTMRDERYATDELVSAIARAGALLSRGDFSNRRGGGANPPLGVGNLSPPAALRMEEDPFLGKRFSISHTSGRAADLAFFVLDRAGRPTRSFETGIGFRRDGWNVSGYRRYYLPTNAFRDAEPQWGCQRASSFRGVSQWKCFVPTRGYRFDDARNWALVKALLLDPDIGVVDPDTGRVRPKDQGIRRILISNPLQERLLRSARGNGAPRELVDLAAAVMTQPTNALPHDDHLHIDLNCAPGDVARCGCLNSAMPPRPSVGVRILPPSSFGN